MSEHQELIYNQSFLLTKRNRILRLVLETLLLSLFAILVFYLFQFEFRLLTISVIILLELLYTVLSEYLFDSKSKKMYQGQLFFIEGLNEPFGLIIPVFEKTLGRFSVKPVMLVTKQNQLYLVVFKHKSLKKPPIAYIQVPTGKDFSIHQVDIDEKSKIVIISGYLANKPYRFYVLNENMIFQRLRQFKTK